MMSELEVSPGASKKPASLAKRIAAVVGVLLFAYLAIAYLICGIATPHGTQPWMTCRALRRPPTKFPATL